MPAPGFPNSVLRRRRTMGTWFEFLLLGHDAEHLAAVAEAALEEVARLERLLSRFDPTSELSRLHREGMGNPVKVDRELFEILGDCLAWRRRTAGWFDVAASGGNRCMPHEPYVLDAERRTVTLADATIRLDFGGYAKGYALDAAARLLTAYGVDDALLHGGTSSIRTLGAGPEGEGEPAAGWPIALLDPASPEEAPLPNLLLRLRSAGLSSSAVHSAGEVTQTPYATSDESRSDIFNPHTGRAVEGTGACVVIASAALTAEVLSTALVAMGRERAGAWLAAIPTEIPRPRRVGWIEPGAPSRLEWLLEETT